MVDYGYVQGTSSELLKAYVFSEPVMIEAPSKGIANLKLPDTKTISSMAAQNSIMTGTQDRSSKNEIFVDIVEELNVTFSSTGTVQNMEIDGRIQMKSFLRTLVQHGTVPTVFPMLVAVPLPPVCLHYPSLVRPALHQFPPLFPLCTI